MFARINTGITPGFVVLGLLVGLATAVRAEGPSWPQFAGPNRDNISTETGLLKSWPDGGPKLLWTAKGIGHGFSSMAITDGRIYTAGNIDGKTVITALDMSGKIEWQVSAWSHRVPMLVDNTKGKRALSDYQVKLVLHRANFAHAQPFVALFGRHPSSPACVSRTARRCFGSLAESHTVIVTL